MLIGVLVLVAMMLIALAVAAPRVASDLQRDKEDELMHRGLQYAHAIRLYYKKFGRYPSNLDQLEKTNEIRFLRKRYKDPVTGKDEWRLIHFGEAKVKTTGLFGQPIANTGAAGASAIGKNQQSGIAGSSFGSSMGAGASTDPSSSTGVTQIGTAFGQSGSQSGPTGSSTFGSPGGIESGGGIGSGGIGSGGIGSGSVGSGNPGSESGSSGFGGQGQTFGGGGIVGIASTSPKASIREFKKQKHYNEWEFVYDPQQEQNGQNGAGILQQPGTNNPNNSIGAPTPVSGTSPIGDPASPTPQPGPTPQQ